MEAEMTVSFEGMMLVWKVMLLSGLIGFCGAIGVWGFCKIARWSPVNITANVYSTEPKGE